MGWGRNDHEEVKLPLSKVFLLRHPSFVLLLPEKEVKNSTHPFTPSFRIPEE